MSAKRNPARMLVILGIGITISVAASAEQAAPPGVAAIPELPAPAELSQAPAAATEPGAPAEAVPPTAPQPPAEAPGPMPAEGGASVIGPPASAEAPAAPIPDAAGTQAAASHDGEGPSSESHADAPFLAPPMPPRSLQTLVDERRDQLRAGRNAWLDAYMPGAMPPWFADYNAGVERYRDAMRSLWRQRRDYDQARHNSWMDAICPWSKPQRDWSRQRSFETQMRQLDRREAMEVYRFIPRYGFGAPPRW